MPGHEHNAEVLLEAATVLVALQVMGEKAVTTKVISSARGTGSRQKSSLVGVYRLA